MNTPDHTERFAPVSQRRRVTRKRTQIPLAIAFSDGQKVPARAIDVSVGGLFLQAERVPEYGEQLTVVVQLYEGADWVLLPVRVRWFAKGSFGVEFGKLSEQQRRDLAILLTSAA
jgi:Tfp pilus assembly protein PilZ